ncbi:ATP-binding cassette domain-containing protein (plasmid) [Bacillus sp. F19]|nr:ATP-binding cassette domain-containing protein [Bacillus sp. F19]
MQLEARNISKRYGKDQWLFRHATVQVHSGEVVGMIGPSGCGKTTFCRILAGYEAGKEGDVLLNGQALPSSGYRPIQLIFQHPERAINPRWRIEQILNEGWNPDEELLELLGISQRWFGRWPSELSGGELQRICIARALAPQTRFFVADEMTTMLDAITQAQIWKTVLEVAEKRSMGLLIVSHDRHLIHRICTRVVDFTQFLTN